MKIYYTAVDNGDGSCSVEFYDSQECINFLEDRDPECYRGEGGRSFEVFDLKDIKGLEVRSMADILKEDEDEQD